ncbi:hypothetical protein V8B97DRAFT_1916679 [Scleroderma yunnanense]
MVKNHGPNQSTTLIRLPPIRNGERQLLRPNNGPNKQIIRWAAEVYSKPIPSRVPEKAHINSTLLTTMRVALFSVIVASLAIVGLGAAIKPNVEARNDLAQRCNSPTFCKKDSDCCEGSYCIGTLGNVGSINTAPGVCSSYVVQFQVS